MGKTKKDNPDRIGIGKFWGWQLRGGSLAANVMVLGYLSIYCSDTLGISTSAVGVILLVSKLFDGVTDLFAGYLIDNTHTRLGKARPYEFAIIGLWFCTWLLFSCPAEWETTVKCIWIFAMYTLVNSIFATLLYSNQQPYMVRAFATSGQIVKLNSYGGIVITLISTVVSITFPQLMAVMATSAEGWSKLAAIFCVPLLVIGMMRFFLVKETVVPADEGKERVSLKDVLAVLSKNKYLYIAAGIGLIYNLMNGLGTAYTYYFTYIGGGIDQYSYVVILSLPLLLEMVFFPAIIKRGIPTSRVILFGGILGAIGYVINFFAGDNLAILMLAAVFYLSAVMPIAYMSGLLLIDCAEYNTYIGLRRLDGTVSAIYSFGNKVGQGLGSAALGFILAAFGYSGTAAVQSASALLGIKLCYSFIPAALYVVIVILCVCYKLDKVLAVKRAEAGK